MEKSEMSHGQVLTSEIAVPESDIQFISPKRKETLNKILKGYQGHLIPLIVRPTEEDDEGKRYEVVYGSDWVLVAKELNSEKLWAWISDLTDEQANGIKIAMEQLMKSSNFSLEEIETIIEQKLQPMTTKVDDFVNQLNTINAKIDKIINFIDPPKPNLMTASSTEIWTILEQAGVKNETHIKAAIKAVEYWKERNALSFENLKKSTKKGQHKQEEFAERTYKKLEKLFKI